MREGPLGSFPFFTPTVFRSPPLQEHTPALLVLADGSVFKGISIGAPGQTVGEVVFNTAMTGYCLLYTSDAADE